MERDQKALLVRGNKTAGKQVCRNTTDYSASSVLYKYLLHTHGAVQGMIKK